MHGKTASQGSQFAETSAFALILALNFLLKWVGSAETWRNVSSAIGE